MKSKTITEKKSGSVVNLSFFVADDELDNILCGCFEGGSNHWITKVEVVNNDYKGVEFASEVISKGGYLNITEHDGERVVKVHELSKPALLNGIAMYGNETKQLDFDKMDSRDYDMILQYAIFLKQKYR